LRSGRRRGRDSETLAEYFEFGSSETTTTVGGITGSASNPTIDVARAALSYKF
jgi:hypothetical protein